MCDIDPAVTAELYSVLTRKGVRSAEYCGQDFVHSSPASVKNEPMMDGEPTHGDEPALPAEKTIRDSQRLRSAYSDNGDCSLPERCGNRSNCVISPKFHGE